MSPSALTLCFLLLPTATGLQLENGEARLCAFTGRPQKSEPAPTNELRGLVQKNGTIRCSRGSRCYGLWEKGENGQIKLLTRGCWAYIDKQQECRHDTCILMSSQVLKASYHFCCCSRDLCNINYTEASPTPSDPTLKEIQKDGRDVIQTGHSLTQKETTLVVLVTVAIVALFIMALLLGYHRMKKIRKLSVVDVMEGGTETATNLDSLKLLELVDRGCYGSVYRGSLGEHSVAVKVFDSTNSQNFINEYAIYGLLQHHDNIARFLTASEKVGVNGRPEFLIVMDFYPNGCLSKYLTLHTVDWWTCCRMAHGMTRGLAYLHTEHYRGDQYKPAVAHRDLTSKNVLVRADLSCVLADFCLSTKLIEATACHPDDNESLVVSKVGTVRYLSPEILGGVLDFRDFGSALKQVDVYALGLLLWETFRRCSDLFTGEAAPEYQLAFQEEVGNHPSFEDMKNLVVQEKCRPSFPEAWKENFMVFRSLKETMKECWEHDAEARLTAQCAEKRVADLTLLTTPAAIHNLRNMSYRQWSAKFGSAPSHAEGLPTSFLQQVDIEPNSEKNLRHESNAEARLSTSDFPMSISVLSNVSGSQHTGGVGLHVPIIPTLMKKDLENTAKDPKKRSIVSSAAHFEMGEEENITTLPSSIHPSSKELNLPQRPTSLQLLPKTKECSSVSSRLRLGKMKLNHRQVETGVAKMNTVLVSAPAVPHQVTVVVSNARGVNPDGSSPNTSSICNSGVPTLVTNVMAGVGRINPAGPQEEEEERGRADGQLNFLHFSPDEQEPLLEREHLLDETDPPHSHLNYHSTARNISNNNNNNLVQRSEPEFAPILQLASLPVGRVLPSRLQTYLPDEGSDLYQDVTYDSSGLVSRMLDIPVFQNPDQDCRADPLRIWTAQNLDPTLAEKTFPQEAPGSYPESHLGVPVTLTEALESASLCPPSESQDGPEKSKAGLPEHGTLQTKIAELRKPELDPMVLLESQGRQKKTRRPERPCSLDLSLSCMSPEDFVFDGGSLSASGEKIKRRVKTPYTLKKWRPSSWVVSTETGLDADFGFSNSSFQTPGSSTNQSKSVAKSNSTPDGMTCF